MSQEIFWLLSTLITFYIWVIIAGVILSWLVAFQVINVHNQLVRSLYSGLAGLTEPALRPIRGVLPNLGGLDISPVILIIGLLFIERILFRVLVGGIAPL